MLIAHDLHFSYQFRPILRGVSFQVEAGRLMKIAGPNGAGKTTLVKIVAGLLAPKKGRLVYRHENQEWHDYRSFLEYLPSEGNGLFGDLDAISNLRFWLNLRGLETGEDRLIQTLKDWQLGGRFVTKELSVAKYSTGMKRRLALCRLILSETKVWLLDEPLYGLDTASVGLFRQALTHHLGQGGAAVLISHDPLAFEGLNYDTLSLDKKRASHESH